ncbi:hypothetical protein BJ741DRAFT_195701 [Chytriomyces cf. hyalinus JEL632]|nr:hypothetical protein BJ741DRAFT_195701 [Chytriomyces cf. hyalinus JEL632]
MWSNKVYPCLYAPNRLSDSATATTNPDLEISSEVTHAPISTNQSFRGPPVDLFHPEDQRLAALFCALVVLINVTCIIFMQFEKSWDFWAAEQWYISSITTLGFGQVHVLTPVSKYALLFFNTVGIILLALILGAVSSKLISLIRKFLLRGIRKVRQKAEMRKNRVEVRRKRQRQEQVALREQGTSTTAPFLTVAPESLQRLDAPRRVSHIGQSTNHHINDYSGKIPQGISNSPVGEETSASDSATNFGVSQIALSRTSTVDSTTEAANELGFVIDDLTESDDDNDDDTGCENPRLPTASKSRPAKKETARIRKNVDLASQHHHADAPSETEARNASTLEEDNGAFLISKKESPQAQHAVWSLADRAESCCAGQRCKGCGRQKLETYGTGTEEVEDVGTPELDTDAACTTEDDGAHILETPYQDSLSLREEEVAPRRKKGFSVSQWLRKTHQWLETHADTVAIGILIPTLLFGGAALLMVAESPDWDYIESLYFNYSLITTTGYGDIYPKTGWGRTLVIIIMFNGLGVWAYAVSTVVARFQAAEVNGMARRIHAQRLARKRRHIINENSGEESDWI